MTADGPYVARLSGYVPGRHTFEAALRVAPALDVRPQSLEVFHGALTHLPSDGLFSLKHMLDGEELLVRAGLARRSDTEIALLQRWRPGEQTPDTLAAIYLARSPPAWLGAATRGGEVDPSFIPDEDAHTLDGLFDDPDRRDALLLALGQKFDDDYRKELGEAGELFVVQECRRRLMEAGAPGLAEQVLQVSRVSDLLGYDVRTPTLDGGVRRLEVKTTVAGEDPISFVVSRNELRTGLADPRWALVVCARDPAGEVALLGWCPAQQLAGVLPPDMPHARWQTVSFSLPHDALAPGMPALDERDEAAP